MNRIKILPENIANKIAAGEVVERPASVIKELLENAIDAGAKRITIETHAGGVGLIRITDDGCGMSREDAMLALERHATSKIATEQDIASVQTLGFRGEALPSIAAVSRLELITKEQGCATATMLRVEGGKVESIGETAQEAGTTLIVRDLFFNVPARRKFLKSSGTENSHIGQTIRLAALSAQNIGFRWICDGEEMINVPASAGLADRIGMLLEHEIAGQILPVRQDAGLLRVGGFAGKPVLHRSNRRYQFFFVNGRPVQNKTLSFALKEAYHSLVMVERHPVCFLFIDLPPQEVDVNVHPAKREVRFRQDSLVRDAVVQGVRAAVQGVEDMPAITPGLSHQERVREAMEQYQISQAQALHTTQPYRAASEGLTPESFDTLHASSLGSKPLQLQLVGQIHRLYLLLESPEGLVILDQHAAHERVLYDQVLGKMRASQIVEAQKLLLPVTIACDGPGALLLKQCLEDLNRMGMEMREFGKNTFIVEAVPFFVKTSDIQTLVKDILDDLAQGERVGTIGKAHEEKVLLTLCRVAVRAADKLLPKEQQALLDQLMAAENPYHCPHGRPTMIKISADYLARQFKRV